jgi:hypothetical protein
MVDPLLVNYEECESVAKPVVSSAAPPPCNLSTFFVGVALPGFASMDQSYEK